VTEFQSSPFGEESGHQVGNLDVLKVGKRKVCVAARANVRRCIRVASPPCRLLVSVPRLAIAKRTRQLS
jgi:hypothetical protein